MHFKYKKKDYLEILLHIKWKWRVEFLNGAPEPPRNVPITAQEI